eukprot:CAMPEP_0185852876 /NCGR_PEP_ID=MMETSP1354-20130828/16701_1 /TAXON_ID=708628 /ORGANISM="Erythrolobus madagascarensis, Strain CCMP3276" /LENGTH=163 /DNA_ID=CAMNT_0028554235 /DNA_START=85 /DNA_END=576 /DNA_ORIENTATION=-
MSWFWCGASVGVGFLDAPAKFRASTLTRPVAMDVGEVLFRNFHKFERVFATATLALAALASNTNHTRATTSTAAKATATVATGVIGAAVGVILVVEHCVIAPKLYARMRAVRREHERGNRDENQQQQLASKSTSSASKGAHVVYIVLESCKVIALAALGFRLS